MERPSWAPGEVDLDQPSIARIYDYYLGGSHNFAADRAFGEQVLRMMPVVAPMARSNRAFLRRAVTFLAGQGVRQFLDLGSGIPTVGNIHEVLAEAGVRDGRVVYLDRDPVAVAHSRAILAEVPGTAVVPADLRFPADVLALPDVRNMLDFTEPIGFMLVAVLHFVPDEEQPASIVAGYAAAGVPGSYVVMSHAGLERELTEEEAGIQSLYRKSPTPVILRNRAQIAELLGDLTVVEPGIVAPHEWRPGAHEETPGPDSLGSAVVARKD